MPEVAVEVVPLNLMNEPAISARLGAGNQKINGSECLLKEIVG